MKNRGNFNQQRILTNREHIYSTNTYWNSKGLVRMNGTLPSKYDDNANCIIEFGDYPSMISLTQKDILKLIYEMDYLEIGTLLNKVPLNELDRIQITIGTYCAQILEQEYDELVSILEDYLKEYKVNYQSFEQFLGCTEFTRKEGSYLLCSLDRNSWSKLFAHAKKYDLYNGKNPEYCFNYKTETIIAINRGASLKKFQLMPGDTTFYTINSFFTQNMELEVLWRIPSLGERLEISNGLTWTAEQTYQWIRKTIA